MDCKKKPILLELLPDDIQYIDMMKDLLDVNSRSKVISLLIRESKQLAPRPARFVPENVNGDNVKEKVIA